MSRGPEVFLRAQRSVEDAIHAASLVLESMISQARLSEAAIRSADLAELHVLLDRANDAIKHPEQFGEYGLLFAADTGPVLAKSRDQAHITMGALPLLLERKALILRRIAQLQPVESLRDMEAAISERITDPGLRDEVVDLLRRRAEAAEETAEAALEEEQETDRAREKVLHEQLSTWKRRSRVYKSFLERESVASLVGAAPSAGRWSSRCSLRPARRK